MAPKPVTSPVPVAWYPSLTVLMLSIGLLVTASFFIYEATSSRKNRSLSKELATGAVASIFLYAMLSFSENEINGAILTDDEACLDHKISEGLMVGFCNLLLSEEEISQLFLIQQKEEEPPLR
ncbi:hypothetical protein HPP92_008778 [Vanilla planifolia]|uniref:Dolichyl-diphosphooligosaccharide-protein glycosyltransferase subunit OST5 n=1 Tax=Vanilla planifolia TaxID=51239 RepID=A0A835R5C3_VANPL|nr:hypothetical protein HPP92_008778 [Vanilla planifolia]